MVLEEKVCCDYECVDDGIGGGLPFDCATALGLSATMCEDGLFGTISAETVQEACPITCDACPEPCPLDCDDVDADGICDDVDDCVGW